MSHTIGNTYNVPIGKPRKLIEASGEWLCFEFGAITPAVKWWRCSEIEALNPQMVEAKPQVIELGKFLGFDYGRVQWDDAGSYAA